MSVCFWDDELFTIGAALEVAMTECERNMEYKLADRFAELYRRVDDAVRGKAEELEDGNRVDKAAQEIN